MRTFWNVHHSKISKAFEKYLTFSKFQICLIAKMSWGCEVRYPGEKNSEPPRLVWKILLYKFKGTEQCAWKNDESPSTQRPHWRTLFWLTHHFQVQMYKFIGLDTRCLQHKMICHQNSDLYSPVIEISMGKAISKIYKVKNHQFINTYRSDFLYSRTQVLTCLICFLS